MKRLTDVIMSGLALLLFMPLMAIVFLAVRLGSSGPALYWSDRVGRHNRIFRMPKFRSMRVETPTVATHLLSRPESFITPVGRLIRSTSLDELPQLWSVLKGDMSLVGPRPALFSQHDLIEQRTERGIHLLRPGITGWAQVNGRDELGIEEKVAYDAEYLMKQSLAMDLQILSLTVWRVVKRDGVAH